jgi:molybdate transport system permease protein
MTFDEAIRTAEPPRESGSAARAGVAFDTLFVVGLGTLLTSYIVLIVGLLAALAMFTTGEHILAAIRSVPIRFAMKLSLLSCTLTTLLSLCIAVPAGYVLSRGRFSGITFRRVGRLARLTRRPKRAGPAQSPAADRSAQKSASPLRVAIAFARALAGDLTTRSGRPRMAEILGTLGNLGRSLCDALLDVPIVLPPLVLGLALLILFNHTRLGRAVESYAPVTFAAPSVVLAQFSVACAFAVRTMRVAFDQINPRTEHVAWTLGCSRWQAFWMVMVPEARRGILTAATLAWARSLGEFGPILVFSGATRMRTEVLPTTVFLELSTGNIEAAAAVSLLMVVTALAILVVARWLGLRGTGML